MTQEFTNILKQYNVNPNNCEDFQPIVPKALEQLLHHYNSLVAFVSACVLISQTEDVEKQLDVVIHKLRHNNYFNDYQEIDEETYDVIILDREVNLGECDEVTLTIHVVNNKVEVSKFIEFGIKGEDYPMSCSIDDVIYTMQQESLTGKS